MVQVCGPHWSSLLSPDQFCPDLVISSVEGGLQGIFPCHRAVLASHSPFLSGLLQDTWEEATLLLPDFNPVEVEQLLLFLYGKLPVVERPGKIYSCLGLYGEQRLQEEEGGEQLEEIEIEGMPEVEEIEDVEIMQGLGKAKYKYTFRDKVPDSEELNESFVERIRLRPLGELLKCEDINIKRTSVMWHIPPITSPTFGEEICRIKKSRNETLKRIMTDEPVVRKNFEEPTNPVSQLFPRVEFTNAGKPVLTQSNYKTFSQNTNKNPFTFLSKQNRNGFVSKNPSKSILPVGKSIQIQTPRGPVNVGYTKIAPAADCRKGSCSLKNLVRLEAPLRRGDGREYNSSRYVT